ncbi:hypothetical protein Taro_046175 [Colocasia esculenta]|uniref:Uncharacterized protein n=1 Tax=Colocasia esculenta TaxID=4460 RepID=A0A843X5S7_COLES|nr:hypothetical protein [Colocasia esculenta]
MAEVRAQVGWNLGQLCIPSKPRLTVSDAAANPMQTSTQVAVNRSRRPGSVPPTYSRRQSMLPFTWDPRQVNKQSNQALLGHEPCGDGPNLASTMVLLKSGMKKIPVEVNEGDNVSELRRELQRLQARLGFELPT